VGKEDRGKMRPHYSLPKSKVGLRGKGEKTGGKGEEKGMKGEKPNPKSHTLAYWKRFKRSGELRLENKNGYSKIWEERE